MGDIRLSTEFELFPDGLNKKGKMENGNIFLIFPFFILGNNTGDTTYFLDTYLLWTYWRCSTVKVTWYLLSNIQRYPYCNTYLLSIHTTVRPPNWQYIPTFDTTYFWYYQLLILPTFDTYWQYLPNCDTYPYPHPSLVKQKRKRNEVISLYFGLVLYQ